MKEKKTVNLKNISVLKKKKKITILFLSFRKYSKVI